MAKNFKIGDLVWAKMKGYPPWPGEIIEPPSKSKSSKGKKPQHYVLFYGSDNHAWIADENILEHNQKLVEEHGTKKKVPAFQKAVETIIENSKNISSAESEGAASPKFKDPERALDTPLESPNSSSEGRKRKSGSKLIESKKRAYSPDISESESASLAERAARYEDVYKDLLNNIPPNIDIDLSMCAPYSSSTSSSILARTYVERPDTPPLDLLEKSTEVLARKIKPTHRKIGFLGLGKIGQGIVKNLQQSGHTVIIWNRSPEKCTPFEEKLNVKVASTPADVVVAADITFCCVSDASAAKALVFGNCGIIKGLQSCPGSNKGYIEMTSMDSSSSQMIADKIRLNGGRYLEAPLKGSRIDANNANLYIQTAGDKSLYDECKTCFDAIAKKHKYLGADVGNASKIHVVYSMFMGAVYCSLAEVMALSLRANVDVSDLLDIMNVGMFENDLLVQKCQAMIDNNYVTQTPLKHMQKDLSLGLQLGSTLEQPTPVVAAANEVFKHCKILRYGDHDVSAVFEGTKP